MQTFLEKATKYLIHKYGDSISDLCIVMPNRRAGLFLKKYLSQQAKKTIWSPDIFSVEDFINELSGLQVTDAISLYFELYETHRNVEKERAESFDNFLSWGKTLLHDFNDIDLHLADPQKIFYFLNSSKAYAVWNLEQKPLSDYQERYLKFYNSLYNYYKDLTSKLLNKNQAYQGLAYRYVADHIEEKINSIKWKKIIFIGFNALNLAEEKIIKHFIECNKAEILWDADNYYIKNPQQEAGKFIRKYINSWHLKEINWIENNFTGTKKINITGVPGNTGQAKLTGHILDEIKKNSEKTERTAVVLADEKLLVPVLNSIPADIKNLNVTMGLPLKYTSAFELFDSLFRMHINSVRLSKGDIPKIYYKDILKIINHPYIANIINLSTDNRAPSDIVKNSNRVLLSDKDIQQIFPSSGEYSKYRFLFDNWNGDIYTAIQCMEKLVEMLKVFFSAPPTEHVVNTDIDIEYIFNFSKIIKRIKSLSDNYKNIRQIDTLRTLFHRIAETTALPFYGEPLKGIQIMGLLETRNLDFENIIMLSVNENIIPASKTIHSFIPHDVRYEFDLPSYKEREAIYAYHFYRLLQRAENTYLIYNTENDDFGSSEQSRFIKQITNELQKYNADITINHRLMNIPVIKEEDIYTIEIPKTKDIIQKLTEKAKSGFSPSSLNTFINCSLQFYFQEIVKIKEPEEVEETVEADTMGKIMHGVLHDLYKPYINKQIKTGDINNMLSQVDKLTKENFKKYYGGGDVKYGKNLLIINIANKYIKNFLRKETDFINNKGPFRIKKLEDKFSTVINISDSIKLMIVLKGVIDRIDEAGNTTRIIDYKTGKVDKNELFVEDWNSLISEPNLAKSFQLLMYSYLYRKNNDTAEKIESGIISLKKLSSGIFNVHIPENDTDINKKAAEQFETIARILLEDIFNPQKPFTQADDEERCKYCDYGSICNRPVTPSFFSE